ncbi:hypothetical protein RFI_07811 [Reticulomyxa filosa]|uniref:Vacuolar protein sorting-associated protein 33A n=1 Tax=Reticulomyxa filosa TaxID=46433 RepID=X6NSP8_RETFI|nr:hypothetical protein RFI_07811 [Reticulomyxa filosa]|eukprot:ETO29315.1 hypothetical protein RFI_07811 [Reticulomyxa filosa]
MKVAQPQAQAAPPAKKKVEGPSLTGDAHLVSSPINLMSLRSHGQKTLKEMLAGVEGENKHLIWDMDLFGPLNHVISPKMLSENGVKTRSGLDQKVNVPPDCNARIFFERKFVSSKDHKKKKIFYTYSFKQKRKDRKIYVWMVPRKTFFCERILGEEGVLGDVKLNEWPIVFFPVDRDVLSLCNEGCLTKLLNGDVSDLYDIAWSLTNLQALFGKFPVINAKGDWSCAVVDIMKRLLLEKDDVFSKIESKPEIAQCIIIDRTVDMITPLLSPRTYEGLLDKVFTINHSSISVPVSILGKSHQKQKQKDNESVSIVLNSSDTVFKQVRNVNFTYLGRILSEMANAIQKGYESRWDAHTTKELSQFMKRFKDLNMAHQLVEQHIHLAEQIAEQVTHTMAWKRKVEHEFALLAQRVAPSGETAEDYLEEMIGKHERIETVLQFMILISLCYGGIASKKYEAIKKSILHSYGMNHLSTLDKMEELGLITPYEYISKFFMKNSTHYFNWSQVSKNLQLVKEMDELKQMTDNNSLGIYDINAMGSGYAPLSIRLIEAATKTDGWNAISNDLQLLKGRHYIKLSLQNQRDLQVNQDISESNVSAHKNILIVFIGGVTYSELSAIRLLESRGLMPWKFIVATTAILSGEKIVSSFVEKK